MVKKQAKSKSNPGLRSKPKASENNETSADRSLGKTKSQRSKMETSAPTPPVKNPNGGDLTPEQVWEKARAIAKANRAKYRKRKGIVDIRATHRFDENGKPTGLPVITIEVEKKLSEDELCRHPNRRLPKEIDGIPVSVVDIRGGVLIGDVEILPVRDTISLITDESLSEIVGRSLALPETMGLAIAPVVTVGWGSRIAPISGSGQQLSGYGSVSGVVIHQGQKYLLTCSHVLSKNNTPIPDVEVGFLDDGLPSPVPIGNSTEPNPVRGHDSSHDCVVIEPSLNSGQIEYRINDPFNPGEFIDPEPGGHYRADRLTATDAQMATRVFHVGTVSKGQVGSVSDIDGSLDATGSTPSTPITTGLIVIQPDPHQTFSQGGDSGAPLIRVVDNAIVGIVIGVRNDGTTVACHFPDVLDFFRAKNFPVEL